MEWESKREILEDFQVTDNAGQCEILVLVDRGFKENLMKLLISHLKGKTQEAVKM